MNLLAVRDPSIKGATISALFHVMNSDTNHFLSYLLEDVVRPDGVKVFGETAIPAGTYKLAWTYSPKFKRKMLILLDVPMFEGIRMHSGKDARHTHGCLIPGMERQENTVTRSSEAVKLIEDLVVPALNHEDVWLTIR